MDRYRGASLHFLELSPCLLSVFEAYLKYASRLS